MIKTYGIIKNGRLVNFAAIEETDAATIAALGAVICAPDTPLGSDFALGVFTQKNNTNEAILKQIAALENSVTPRTWRESISAPAAINPVTGKTASAFIVAVDAQIAALRLTLVP